MPTSEKNSFQTNSCLVGVGRLALSAAACLMGPHDPKSLLEAELDSMRARYASLEVTLHGKTAERRKPVRIFMEGAFDLMHYGHMNAFRQGKAYGDVLIVGVNSSASIAVCKGPPVLSDDERVMAVKSCRFVDEVIRETPYVMTAEYLDWIVKEYDIDFVVHGDDPCIVDGKDVYADAKARGIYRSIPRTEGVSTTDIVGRMLLHTKSHHVTYLDEDMHPVASKPPHKMSCLVAAREAEWKGSLACHRSSFLTTSAVMRQFSMGLPLDGAKKAKRIVYIDGAWDMFHSGHIDTLRRARELGDFLLVGVHHDAVVNQIQKDNFPVMNMQERVLSVLGCQYVDDVLLDAPWAVTRTMLASLEISVIAQVSVRDEIFGEDEDPYRVPKDMGIFTLLDSDSNLTVTEIMNRVEKQHLELRKRYEEKSAGERSFFEQKHAADTGGTRT